MIPKLSDYPNPTDYAQASIDWAKSQGIIASEIINDQEYGHFTEDGVTVIENLALMVSAALLVGQTKEQLTS